jgi:hypothetical protein
LKTGSQYRPHITYFIKFPNVDLKGKPDSGVFSATVQKSSITMESKKLTPTKIKIGRKRGIKRSYGECCDVSYGSPRDHLKSQQHIKFAATTDNYRRLDRCLAEVPSVWSLANSTISESPQLQLLSNNDCIGSTEDCSQGCQANVAQDVLVTSDCCMFTGSIDLPQAVEHLMTVGPYSEAVNLSRVPAKGAANRQSSNIVEVTEASDTAICGWQTDMPGRCRTTGACCW